MTSNMFILEVSPLLAIPRNQSQLFSYFSDQSLPPGSAVEIAVGNRKTLGLVFRSDSLKALKITLRKERDFSVKPISKILSARPVVTEAQLRLAFWLASHYFAPLGLCLKTILPPFFNKKKYPSIAMPASEKSVGQFKELLIRTANLQNHYKDYEALLESNKNKQILLVVPEISYISYFQNYYQHLDPQVVHSRLANQNLYNLHKKVSSGEPVFIIGTRIGSFLPFKNLGLIILDNESNDTSRSDTTPRYETGELLNFLAKEHRATLVINDLVPRPEILFRHPASLNKSYLPPLKTKPLLVNMLEEIKNQNFSIFSEELQKQLLETVRNRGRVMLFLPRKGYARALVCAGCSTAIQCPRCSTSLVVHALAENKKILRCHRCRHEQEFVKVCPRCHNFMLESSGLALQKVSKKLTELFARHNRPPPAILELSNDSAPQEPDEEKIIRQFQASSPAILVGTQKLLSWLYLLKSDLMGIINADLSTLFPDFRTEEKALRIFATLAQMADQTIIQTYSGETPSLKALLGDTPAAFWEEELSARQAFAYPPFSEFIRLEFRHALSSYFKEAGILAEKLKREITIKGLGRHVELMGPQAAFTSKEKGKYVWNIFLKIKNLETVKRNELLRLVPSKNWRLDINPRESL